MKRVIIISAILIHCLLVSSQVGTAIIKGKVHSGNVKSVKVRYSDNQISQMIEYLEAPVDRLGQFELKIPVSQAAKGMIFTGDFVHDICLLPSDNFFVDIDGDTIKYKGKGAEKNNFLYFIELKGHQDRMYFNEINKCELSPKEFAIKMARFRDERIVLFDEYFKSRPVEQLFKEYFLAENSAIYVQLIMNYPERYSYFNKVKKDSLELSDEYRKYNLLKNVVDDKMVLSDTYVNNLRNFLFTKSTELRKLNVKGDPFNILMLDSLKGKTQQYVMANWIYSDLSFDRLDTFIYDKFKKLDNDPLVIKTVDKALEKYYQKRALIGQPLNGNFINTQLEDTAGNAISFGKMMEKFKGKVVYLDIWGLACGPCRGAMPYSKRVREKLAGRPVEFVFLTIEGMDKKRWEEAFKVSLVKENHYRLSEGWQAPFLKFMAINWVPCYMIIDKEGKLASYSAPNPFDELGLESELVKLTK